MRLHTWSSLVSNDRYSLHGLETSQGATGEFREGRGTQGLMSSAASSAYPKVVTVSIRPRVTYDQVDEILALANQHMSSDQRKISAIQVGHC